MKVSIAALGKFHAFDLAEDMRQRGYLHRLYTGYPKARIPVPLRPYANTCPYLTVPMMLAGRYRWEGLHNILNVAATVLFDTWLASVLEPCDVFHCWASYGRDATMKANQFGAKTICDRGSTNLLHQQVTLKSEYLKWHQFPPRNSSLLTTREIEQYAVANTITVPSKQAAETFDWAGLKPAVVPYGVDLMKFRAVPKEDHVFRVLYVGALSLRKGIPYLIQAYLSAFLNADRHKWELWLVGTPLKETEHWLKDLSACHVKVWGAVPQDQLPWFYSQASVVVMPSIEEGLALVLGQALACGVPVIATRESGVEELITDGVEGFVVKARDPQDIATYLTRLAAYDDEREWMQQQIAKRRGDWHWRHYGERMLKVYEA